REGNGEMGVLEKIKVTEIRSRSPLSRDKGTKQWAPNARLRDAECQVTCSVVMVKRSTRTSGRSPLFPVTPNATRVMSLSAKVDLLFKYLVLA
ncbi:hypothetical protein Bpfe_029669, partial [Biomphalaria pfeifferi]